MANKSARLRKLSLQRSVPKETSAAKPRPKAKNSDEHVDEKVKISSPASLVSEEERDMVHLKANTAFKVLISARICAAIWSNISDCDETFNYWEPMHYMMYGKGMQTWEYSPEYALRSYGYILFHVLPALIYDKVFSPNRMLVFYFVRCLLGFSCALLETYFYKSVCRRFGVHIGRLTLLFLLFSPGMFIASSAFLPSSFSMLMVILSMTAWFERQYALAVLATALSSLLSWPFAALIGVPIAFEMVFLRRQVLDFVKYSVISLVIVLAPIAKIDSDNYGKVVVAPLNIVLYNVFSSSRGPDLYGTEPWHFYLSNGFLNFNLVFPLALISLLTTAVVILISEKPDQRLPNFLHLSPLYLWLAVFGLQQHKEERFLFPIYPLVCFCGAVALDGLQRIVFFTLKKVTRMNLSNYLRQTNFFAVGTAIIFVLLGLSRSFALYKGYHAPLDIYMELAKFGSSNSFGPNSEINVCVGKEWHRFPSSFFLPDNRWNLRFLESEFKGQLPQPYQPGPDGTSVVPPNMNDMNQEERSRYFDIGKCDFLVDLETNQETKLEPNYAKDTTKWDLVHSIPFLDNERSPKLLRAFYIPFLTEEACTYASYQLLKASRGQKGRRVGVK
ncbi:alpha-1,2-mannosyltransferase ALG9 [Neocloeon triangulifer]|uniref:alpha-1,2-mannosyltransferase ALG9 n=1 Tax=Neocloeon triangulifer TaxID=2078957 RepID=UPI00286F0D03|nr:alpha-1,2-mannosyltransferase ALG9 [Neocloeon triangulifer]